MAKQKSRPPAQRQAGAAAPKKASPALRFFVALLIVIAVAFVAFFVGYLVGMRLAVLPFTLPGIF